MLVVVMASQKGGSGKTTLSGHLAVEAEAHGAGPVALIDTDPQGSLSHWWNARKAKSPHFARVGAFDLNDALDELRNAGMRLAIIDTPPAISDSISRVIAHGDLIVVPTRPSPHDLRAVGATVDMAERHGKPLVFVVNDATQRARITGEAAISLSQHGVVAPVMIHHRVDFAASMVDGRTVGEVVPKSASAKEVRDLWLYIQERLARLKKDPTLLPETQPDHSVDALSAWDALDEPQAPPLVAEENQTAAAANGTVTPSEPMTAEPINPPPIHTDHGEMERRSGAQRRQMSRGPVLFSGSERRSNPFGRRHVDHNGEAGPRK
jgi:chromosome partitioning protein